MKARMIIKEFIILKYLKDFDYMINAILKQFLDTEWYSEATL